MPTYFISLFISDNRNICKVKKELELNIKFN